MSCNPCTRATPALACRASSSVPGAKERERFAKIHRTVGEIKNAPLSDIPRLLDEILKLAHN